MLSLNLVIIFTTFLAWSFCDDSLYCSLCQDHTLCKYTDNGPDCKDSGYAGVSDSEKQEIVNIHNFLRRTVATGNEKRGPAGGQPKAANLRKFVWDNEMARVAQRWANQCRFGHDSCRQDPRWYVGQNIYWKSQSSPEPLNWTNVVMTWYQEVDKFDPQGIDVYRFDPQTGHYTQLLWYGTYAIGCGRKDYGTEKLCVCNYGPGGNIIGNKMYIKGEPCTGCPDGTFCEDGLCAEKPVNFKSGTPPDQETNAYWRSNAIPEEDKSINSELEANVSKDSSTKLETLENSKRKDTTGQDDNDFDEKTKEEIKKILDQIEKLLKMVIKKYKNSGKENTKLLEILPPLKLDH